MWVWSLGQEDSPGGGNGQPTLVFLLGKFHGQRSLAGHSLRDHKESEMTEWAHTRVFHDWLTSPKTVWIESTKWFCHDSSWRVFHFIKYFGMMLLLIPMKHLNWTLLETLRTGLPWWLSGEDSAGQCRRHGFDPWSRKIPHAVEQLSPCAKTIEPVL